MFVIFGIIALIPALLFSATSINPLLQTSSTPVETKHPLALEEVMLDSLIDSNYIVGSGDVFEVFLEDHNVVVQVGPEGSIILEQLGGVFVSGQTLGQAKKNILSLVTRKYSPSLCFVHLLRVRKFYVSIYGAVVDPRQHLIHLNLRVSHALRFAGGVLATADWERIIVIRGKDTLNINLKSVSSQGAIEQDLIVKPGDIIFVPFVNVESRGVLVSYKGTRISRTHIPGRTILGYLEDFDALRTENAIDGVIYALNDETESKFIPFAKINEITPEPGSSITVVQKTAVVHVSGAINVPGQLTYVPGYTAYDYVAIAGISPVTGSFSQIVVRRKVGQDFVEIPHSEAIKPGDFISISKSKYESTKDFLVFLSTIASILLTVIVAHSTLNQSE